MVTMGKTVLKGPLGVLKNNEEKILVLDWDLWPDAIKVYAPRVASWTGLYWWGSTSEQIAPKFSVGNLVFENPAIDVHIHKSSTIGVYSGAIVYIDINNMGGYWGFDYLWMHLKLFLEGNILKWRMTISRNSLYYAAASRRIMESQKSGEDLLTPYGLFERTLPVDADPGVVYDFNWWNVEGPYYLIRPTKTITILNESPLVSVLEEISIELQLICDANTESLLWYIDAGAMPTGLSMSTAGLISGTIDAEAGGNYSFTVRVVSDTGEWGTKDFTWASDANSVVIDTATPLAGMNDCTAVSLQFEAHGSTGTYTWQVTSGALPGGLSLSSGGLLTGTPDSSSGTFNFGITATDTTTAKTGQKDFSVSVALQAPTVNGGLQVVMSFNLDGNPNPSYGNLSGYASGGKAPYTWSWVSGSGNISITSAGAVYNSTLGYSSCTGRCTGANGAYVNFMLTVTVSY
jgi:hypothetical protein